MAQYFGHSTRTASLLTLACTLGFAPLAMSADHSITYHTQVTMTSGPTTMLGNESLSALYGIQIAVPAGSTMETTQGTVPTTITLTVLDVCIFAASGGPGTGTPIGNLCLGGSISRFNRACGEIRNSGTAGEFGLQIDLTNLPITDGRDRGHDGRHVLLHLLVPRLRGRPY